MQRSVAISLGRARPPARAVPQPAVRERARHQPRRLRLARRLRQEHHREPTVLVTEPLGAVPPPAVRERARPQQCHAFSVLVTELGIN